MPASIKLKEEYGDDLHVLFVESQGADDDKAEAFAWRQKWMGARAMWTTERPVEVEGNTLPKYALLDTEGKLLSQGNPLADKKRIEEAIAEQVKLAKAAPAGTPAKLSKVWSTFQKGNIGAALAECEALGSADASLAEAAGSLRAEMVARTNSQITRAKWMLDNGYVTEASAAFEKLGKAVKGSSEFEGSIAAELTRITRPDESLRAESEASKALSALEARMLEDKPFDEGFVKALTKLAEKHAGTKAAERATHLVALSKIKF